MYTAGETGWIFKDFTCLAFPPLIPTQALPHHSPPPLIFVLIPRFRPIAVYGTLLHRLPVNALQVQFSTMSRFSTIITTLSGCLCCKFQPTFIGAVGDIITWYRCSRPVWNVKRLAVCFYNNQSQMHAMSHPAVMQCGVSCSILTMIRKLYSVIRASR